MILDNRNEFCDATSIAASAGTALVGDVIDLGANVHDIGTGEDLYAVVLVSTAVESAGAATVQFKLASDAQAAIATDGTATIHAETAAIGKASLVAGSKAFAVKLPQGTYERYLGVLVTTAVATTSAGAINAFLTKDVSSLYAYPDAVN